jgi:nucleotide-binding universal stress UspA family protein
MKRILVPIDFSSCSIQALKVAAQIARKNNCDIILLHLLELPHQTIDAFGNFNTLPEVVFFKDKAVEKLEELMDAPYLEGIEVYESFELKKVDTGIIDASIKNNADLIVMGSYGTSGFDEEFVGSNTEKIVRFSEIPVLVIKNEIEDFEVANIVFASDFSKETLKPFRKMLDFIKIFNSKLFLVTISTPASFKPTASTEKNFNNFISNFEIEDYSFNIFNDANIEKGIINFSNRVKADIIVICTHGRTGLSHFFNGSIGEDLVNHSNKPVLTFKI